jgi:hypothetical protein
MLEALWSMKVMMNGKDANAGGVVVIENGRIFGGDSGFTWVGDLKVEGNLGTARVHVRKYQSIPGFHSITGLDEYHATFKGAPARDRMLLTGHPDGHPNVVLTIELVRRAELP